MPNLNTGILRSVAVRYPRLPIQRRIASILSAYDDLIENNTRRIKILEDMAQMLYREWFVNFRFPGHRKVKMVKSELGPIPEEWSTGTISQIAILHRDGINPSDFPDELFLHFSIPSFDNSRTPVREKGTEIKSNKYRVVPGCVLLSKLNPRIPRLWMPSLGSGLREITSTEFLVLTPPVELHRSYLFQFLSSEEFSSSLTGLSLGTSTSHQRVKPDDFLNLPSLLPAHSVMDEFCRNVDPMMEEMSVLRSKNINLRTTRDFLLPKLISGEISVEAAAELVEQTA
jgi:type I restriction enzyme S subunit